MEKIRKHKASAVKPIIETKDLNEFANRTGNLYKTLNVISKRANQIGNELREELHSKLEEFASSTDNLEEVFENREQIEISRYYERLPHPTLLATNEFTNDQIYYRKIETEQEEENTD